MSVTVPEVVFVRFVPERIAETKPLLTVNEVPERTPVVPWIVPLVSVTRPTESLKPAMLSTPPFTVTSPVESAPDVPKARMPPVTLVRPV